MQQLLWVLLGVLDAETFSKPLLTGKNSLLVVNLQV